MTRLVICPSHWGTKRLLIAKRCHTNPFQSQRPKESAVWLFLQGVKVHSAASQVSAGRRFGDDEGEFLPSQRLLSLRRTAFLRTGFPPSVYSRRTAQRNGTARLEKANSCLSEGGTQQPAFWKHRMVKNNVFTSSLFMVSSHT